MKAILALIFSLVFTTFSSCQEQRTVKCTVLNEDGSPVVGAEVHIAYIGQTPESGVSIKGLSNPLGVVVANGSAPLRIKIMVAKKGYYSSVVSGLSKLKDHELNIVLRKIKKPIPLYAQRAKIYIPLLDKPCGFDFREDDWKPYFDHGTSEEDDEPGTEIRLFASEWYKLFPAADNRYTLTWKNIFAKPELLNVAYNFYSPGEEVVENANETEQFGDLDNLVWNAFESRHSWVTQEIAKGGQNIAAGAGLDELNGGWEFNYKDGANSPAFGDVAEGYYKWLNPNNTPSFSRKYFSSETHEITNNELKTKPFYKPFIYPELYDPATGHDTAGNQRKRYKVLASGVPAMSYAIAANNLEAFDVSPTNPVSRNFNMQLEMKTKRGAFAWPVKFERLPEDWLHSDFKDVTIQFTHPLYEKIIELGKLNENEN